MSLSRRLVGLTADQPRVESSLKPFEIINLKFKPRSLGAVLSSHD